MKDVVRHVSARDRESEVGRILKEVRECQTINRVVEHVTANKDCRVNNLKSPSNTGWLARGVAGVMSCCGNIVDGLRSSIYTNARTGELTVRMVGTRDLRRYLTIARDVGLRTMGLGTDGSVLNRGLAWMEFPRRYRNLAGGAVCVLGAAAAYAVVVGLNRRSFLAIGDGAECGGSQSVGQDSEASPRLGPLPGSESCCSQKYKVGDEEEEYHPRCIHTGKSEGLVNQDLLAYLRPYAVFQKRTASLLAILKGRAILWRRRQRVSEHCFAHALPGTLVAAMEMAHEEVLALRALGMHSEAGRDVYAEGVDPSKLRRWWSRGGTEDWIRPGWLLGTFKVEG